MIRRDGGVVRSVPFTLGALVLLVGCTGSLSDEPAPDGGSIVLLDGSAADVPPGTDGGPGPTDGGGPGVDGAPSCGAGQMLCAGACRDVSSDPMNCGACGMRCPTGATCAGSACMGGTGCAPAPAGASANAAAAIDLANEVRTAMGVPCQTQVATINLAAERHCEYYSSNTGSCVANAHSEVAGCNNFVAESFADRMRIAGYMGSPAFEDMHFVGDGRQAVQGWIDSVWHRTPVLSPWIRDSGYGNTSDCDTMDFGRGASTPNNVVATYPYGGQTGVPRSFDGRREGPMPPAPTTGWPSGYPVVIYLRGSVSSHTIRVDGTSTDLPHVWISPDDSSLLSNEFFLYANEPLAASTTYRVTIVGTGADGPVTLDWTFTTE
jgi:hypothetical protein